MLNRITSTWLVFLGLLLFSCKKENGKEVQAPLNNPYAEKVKTWFNSANRKAKPGANFAARSVSSNYDMRDGDPDWEKTRYFEESKIYVTPVNLGISGSSIYYAAYKYLITEENGTGEINKGTFIYLSVNNDRTSELFKKMLPYDLPESFFSTQKISSDYTGTILKYDLDYSIVKTRLYEKGIEKEQQENLMVKIEDNFYFLNQINFPVAAKKVIKCTDWYLVGYDDSGDITFVNYFYSSCEESDDGTGSPIIGTGGGNYQPPVPPSPDPQCNMTEEQAQNAINNIAVSSISEGVRYLGGNASNPDINGKIRKPKNPILGLARVDFFLNYYVHYSAFFKGIVYKMNANDKWKWENCEYNYTARDEGNMPPCFYVKTYVNASASVISPNKFDAATAINFQFIAEVSCLPGTPATGDIYRNSFTAHFDSQQDW